MLLLINGITMKTKLFFKTVVFLCIAYTSNTFAVLPYHNKGMHCSKKIPLYKEYNFAKNAKITKIRNIIKKENFKRKSASTKAFGDMLYDLFGESKNKNKITKSQKRFIKKHTKGKKIELTLENFYKIKSEIQDDQIKSNKIISTMEKLSLN